MKTLVRFWLIFICTKLAVTKPQHLQEHPQYHLDPLNEPQFDYPPKDPGKRTIGSHRHYAFGKHVGIHPSGFRYVLGYSPINVKYVPVIKPVTVLKPVLQQSIKPLWRPVGAPTRHYLPPFVHVSKPIHQVDHGWKPVASPIHHHKPWLDEVEHVHPVVEEPVPVQPALPIVKPFVPLPAPVVPGKPALHNYYFFQTPIAKPALLPQVPLFHVGRPQLGVLPLGASFPAHVFQPSAPGIVPVPSAPAALPVPAPVHPPHVHQFFHPQPVYPPHVHPPHVNPPHVHPPHVHPQHVYPQPIQPVVPVHHPFPVHQHPLHPVHTIHNPVPVLPHPAPQPPLQVHVPHQPAAPPPISVEYHGNRHLVPFNNQFPFTSIQSSFPLPLPIPKAQPPLVLTGRQPHALPLPPEVHTHPEIPHSVPNFHPVEQPMVHHQPPTVYQQPPFQAQPVNHPEINLQAPFNPSAAIQPGQTDLQFPMHLPHHPHFRQIQGANHFQPVESLQPQFPPFHDQGNALRPSISLEPPLTHGHG